MSNDAWMDLKSIKHLSKYYLGRCGWPVEAAVGASNAKRSARAVLLGRILALLARFGLAFRHPVDFDGGPNINNNK